MKNKMIAKKLVLGLAFLSTSIPAAYALNCPNLLPVCRPEFCGRFGIGLEGDYFKVGGIDTQYGYYYDFTQFANAVPFPIGTSYSTRALFVGLDSHWGYKVDLSYYIPCTSTDIQLVWQDYQHTDSSATSVGPYTTNNINGVVTVFNANGYLGDNDMPTGGIFSDLQGKFKTRYNTVDLVAGQHLNFGSRVNIRPFAGLRYAYLRVNSTVNERANLLPGTFSLTQNSAILAEATSQLNSLGLRGGSEIKYNFGSGFSLTGTFGGSLLAGRLKKDSATFFLTFASVAPPAAPVSFQRTLPITYPNKQILVPELDARLALGYAYNFGCNCDKTLDINIGYQESYYFKAQERVNTANTRVEIAERGDFSLRGPFVRLSYAF